MKLEWIFRKKFEILHKVINREAMANPGCLDWYVAFAQRHAAGTKT